MLTAVSSEVSATTVGKDSIEDLWEQRAAIIVKYRAALKAYSQAESALPEWADSGPRDINHLGEKCGANVGWPEVKDVAAVGVPDREGSYRVIRPSPYDIKNHFRMSLNLWLHNKAQRQKLKEIYRAKLDVVRTRIKERDELRDKLGLTAASNAMDWYADALYEIDQQIKEMADGSPAWLAAGAILEIGCNMGPKVTISESPELQFYAGILRSMSNRLRGRIAQDAAAVLSDTPLHKLGCYC